MLDPLESSAAAAAPVADARPAAAGRLVAHPRLTAALEVILCSGIPTQLAIAALLVLAGWAPAPGDPPNILFVVTLLLADTCAVTALMAFFMWAHGERARTVWLGSRPVAREALLGLALVPTVFLMVVVLLNTLRLVAPWLHNVPVNPFAQLLDSPANAWLFAVVALIGGGVREEIQRAFLLTRFEQHLGGATVGLVVTSIAFGLGHVIQGLDAGIATGTLGLAWGAMYLWRRSALAPIASHAGFNALEIVRYLVLGPGTV